MPFSPKWPWFTRARLHWEKVVLVAYQRSYCTRGKWFAHQSYYIKKDHQWCAPKIPLHKSTPQVLLFLTKTNINSWHWKQTKFHGGGRSWPGLVTQERILKNSTDTEGAVDSVRINTKIHLKLRMDSFAYLPIAVAFAHWNFLFFLGDSYRRMLQTNSP